MVSLNCILEKSTTNDIKILTYQNDVIFIVEISNAIFFDQGVFGRYKSIGFLVRLVKMAVFSVTS